jgi:hypothetical protein
MGPCLSLCLCLGGEAAWLCVPAGFTTALLNSALPSALLSSALRSVPLHLPLPLPLLASALLALPSLLSSAPPRLCSTEL